MQSLSKRKIYSIIQGYRNWKNFLSPATQTLNVQDSNDQHVVHSSCRRRYYGSPKSRTQDILHEQETMHKPAAWDKRRRELLVAPKTLAMKTTRPVISVEASSEMWVHVSIGRFSHVMSRLSPSRRIADHNGLISLHVGGFQGSGQSAKAERTLDKNNAHLQAHTHVPG